MGEPVKWISAAAAMLMLIGGASAHASADESQAPPSATPVVYIAPPVDYGAVIAYMRTLPPDVLIRIAFADTPHTDAMLKIARRESGLLKGNRVAVPFDPACSAANPRSSARGLFQTLRGWQATAQANGLSWANVEGPDCLDDVLLARAIYAGSGLKPWAL